MAYERSWAWSFDNSHVTISALDALAYSLWACAAMLTGGSLTGGAGGGLPIGYSGYWTVAGSSNGVAGGMDAVDRWHLTGPYTLADFVQGANGVAHSWIVLQSPVLVSGIAVQMLLTLSSGGLWKWSKSTVGFTGGSATQDPTATDSWGIDTAGDTAITTYRYNMCLTSTGDFIYFSTQTGVPRPVTTAMVVAPVGCHPADTYPVWTWKLATTANTSGFNIDTMAVTNGPPTRTFNGLLGNEFILIGRRQVAVSTADSLTGGIGAWPFWVAVQMGSPNYWHARGRLPDILVMQTDIAAGGCFASGNTVRSGGNIVAVTAGGLLIPASVAPTFV